MSEIIYDFLITLLILCIQMTTNKFKFKSDTSKIAVGEPLFQIKQGQWVLTGNHSKKLPKAVCNYGITELELRGFVCNRLVWTAIQAPIC